MMNLNPNQNRNLNHDVSWPVAARKCHLGSGPRGRRAHSAHCAHSEIAQCAQWLAPCTWKTPTLRAHRVVHRAHRAGAFLKARLVINLVRMVWKVFQVTNVVKSVTNGV